MKNKIAIITGITGQDGAYLAHHLLNLNYKVVGAYRRTSSANFWRLQELEIQNHPNLSLYEFDLTDFSSVIRLIEDTQPTEIYNLAAQSFVGTSFEQPINTSTITAFGPLNLLEGIRAIDKSIKFYQASTSEMFGHVQAIPQNEETPFYPRSPYGVAKLFAHWMTINYRESYGIYGTNGILFNHESPLRGLEFVTRKITNAVAKISKGTLDFFELGNLDAKRDWGFAGDYVKGMHLMLQADTPDCYVLATNKTTSVREFVKLSFEVVGINIVFKGSGTNEIGVDEKNGKTLVKVSPKFFRPAEVDLLIGDPKKALNTLNWKPSTSLEKMCELMVNADLKRVENGFKF